jgi:four helix bundle protein
LLWKEIDFRNILDSMIILWTNPNNKAKMPNQAQSQKSKKYNLVDRTSSFGEDIILFVQMLLNSSINDILIKQIVRSATSIGANYMEADCCDSKNFFCYKISLCKKESKETIHWLKMILKANPMQTEEIETLKQEVHELTLIFSKILINTKK